MTKQTDLEASGKENDWTIEHLKSAFQRIYAWVGTFV